MSKKIKTKPKTKAPAKQLSPRGKLLKKFKAASEDVLQCFEEMVKLPQDDMKWFIKRADEYTQTYEQRIDEIMEHAKPLIPEPSEDDLPF